MKNKKTYMITYTIYQTIEIDEDELKNNGYEDRFYDSDWEEYLDNRIIENEKELGIYELVDDMDWQKVEISVAEVED